MFKVVIAVGSNSSKMQLQHVLKLFSQQILFKPRKQKYSKFLIEHFAKRRLSNRWQQTRAPLGKLAFNHSNIEVKSLIKNI